MTFILLSHLDENRIVLLIEQLPFFIHKGTSALQVLLLCPFFITQLFLQLHHDGLRFFFFTVCLITNLSKFVALLHVIFKRLLRCR